MARTILDGRSGSARPRGTTMFHRLNTVLMTSSDAALAALIVLILLMLIVPLPTLALDFVIGLNITLGATILMASLYIPSAARFPSFPTLLLVATLFRLAINVSSTRLILLQADAGHIIQAFGDFVVQGNYIVGAVIFLILVLIQFIVIAKGSERVAEVSARFSLDMMTGKQNSIEHDLKNNAITNEEAAERRLEMERESRVYGAMDGAMKFVKGDAIAGIVITLINVLGGMGVGVLQQQMSMGEAAQIYTLLTIGDGLVSQIPALLLTFSAGLVVTRVASGEQDERQDLASDLIRQITAQPRSLYWVALFLFGLVWLPGFPKPVFIVLSVFVAVVATVQRRRLKRAAQADALKAKKKASAPQPNIALYPVPIELQISSTLRDVLMPREPADARNVRNTIENRRVATSRMMGVVFPEPRLSLSALIGNDCYQINIMESPRATAQFSTTHAVMLVAPASARESGFEGDPIRLPWSNVTAFRIAQDDAERAREAGFGVLTAREFILEHLFAIMHRTACEVLGIQETRALLDSLERNGFGALVQELVPAKLSLQQVTEVLQRLLQEEVPIRDLRAILGSLTKWGDKDLSVGDLTELVRLDMSRAICTSCAFGGQTLLAYSIDQHILNEIGSAISQTAEGPIFAGSPELRQDIIKSIASAIHPSLHLSNAPPVLIVHMYRPVVARLIRNRLPQVRIISTNEWSESGLNAKQVALINLSQPASAIP